MSVIVTCVADICQAKTLKHVLPGEHFGSLEDARLECGDVWIGYMVESP